MQSCATMPNVLDKIKRGRDGLFVYYDRHALITKGTQYYNQLGNLLERHVCFLPVAHSIPFQGLGRINRLTRLNSDKNGTFWK